MKKLLALLMGITAATFLIMGCVAAVETYSDLGRTIGARVNQEFIIALGSNPTTGYSWQATYDAAILEMGEKTLKQSETEEGMVGVGGIEYFPFKALEKGRTEITMTYKREWEEEGIEQKVCVVNIR